MKALWKSGRRKFHFGGLFFFVLLLSVQLCSAEESETVIDAFKNGKFSGVIGHYFERVETDADNADYG